MSSALLLENIWQECLKILQEELGSRVVETWFKAISFSYWDANKKIVYLKVPNAFVQDWVGSKYKNILTNHLSRLLNELVENVIFTEQPHDIFNQNIDIQPAIKVESKQAQYRAVVMPEKTVESKQAVALRNVKTKTVTNQAYQFESFVVGPNNSLAYAASIAATEKPGILYNPLFIYGACGLGKTHLLHAIGNQIKVAWPKAKILYQSADRFVHEFINAIRFDKVAVFESKYKELDVLLIDDIQFISNKEQTQEAFFHVFNALYEARKQIVFTSDSMPKDIAGLAQRLRSRLEGGLLVDIQIPSLETKVAILKKKADFHGETLADDVAYFISSRALSNIRELEGMLIRVLAFANLTNQPISLDLAHKVLLKSSITKNESEDAANLQFIGSKVASYYKFTLKDLKSDKRTRDLTFARHVSMYLMKKLTDKSLIDIALFFNRRDHSTVIYALEKIDFLKLENENFASDILKLENSCIF